MKAILASVLGLSLGLPSVAVAGPVVPVVATATAPDADKPPEVLYEEGKKAYRLGRFDEAVLKWEKAYDLSERSLLLYNISLAYKGRYTISRDVEDLRKARAVMNNFLIIAQSDPEVDADDAPERIAELDKMIAEAEAHTEGPTEPPVTEPKAIVPEGPDPGRTFRIAGAATMGGGGLLVVTATVLGIYFGVRGQELSDELRRKRADHFDRCTGVDSAECDALAASIEDTRQEGRNANLGLGLGAGIAGGLGLVAVGAGAILFVQGNRRTAEWKKTGFTQSLRLVPTGRGLALQGRF